MLTCPNCGYYVSLAPRLQRELEAEIAALRADIERHIAIASEHATECERLRAELAECREDAERYRWLRKIADMDFFEPPNSAVCNAVTPEHLDEIIDAALAMNDAAREGEGEA